MAVAGARCLPMGVLLSAGHASWVRCRRRESHSRPCTVATTVRAATPPLHLRGGSAASCDCVCRPNRLMVCPAWFAGYHQGGGGYGYAPRGPPQGYGGPGYGYAPPYGAYRVCIVTPEVAIPLQPCKPLGITILCTGCCRRRWRWRWSLRPPPGVSARAAHPEREVSAGAAGMQPLHLSCG